MTTTHDNINRDPLGVDRHMGTTFNDLSGLLNSRNRDNTEESDLSSIFSQSRAVYPFLLLLVTQFIVGHSFQAIVYLGLSTCIGYINMKFKEQVALKEKQSTYALYKLIMLNLLFLFIGERLASYLGVIQIFHRWITFSYPSNLPIDIPYLLWTTAMTDLLTRSLSTIAKLLVSVGLVPHMFACEHILKNTLIAIMSGLPINDRDADQFVRHVVNHDISNLTKSDVYKRRRVLYACIETFFVMYRSILPIPVWCAYFYSGSMGSVFVCIYLAFKTALVISCFGRFLRSYLSYANPILEHGTHIAQVDDEEQGDGDGGEAKSCPICMESINRAVMLDCKHLFCENCISEWLERERTCPVCRSVVNSRNYDPSSAFRDGRTFMVPIIM